MPVALRLSGVLFLLSRVVFLFFLSCLCVSFELLDGECMSRRKLLISSYLAAICCYLSVIELISFCYFPAIAASDQAAGKGFDPLAGACP